MSLRHKESVRGKVRLAERGLTKAETLTLRGIEGRIAQLKRSVAELQADKRRLVDKARKRRQAIAGRKGPVLIRYAGAE